MKKIPLILLLSVLLFSCTDFTDEKHYYVDKKFVPIVQEFLYEAKKRGLDFSEIDMIMIHKEMTDNCGLTVYGIKTIYIDTTSACWGIDKKELVFHELGHYLLHREHDNTLFKIGRIQIPKSIMIGVGYIINFQDHYKYYMDELFNPNTKTPY